jgi:hypothetical protein
VNHRRSSSYLWLALADIGGVATLRPRHPARLLADLAHPRSWVGVVGADSAVVTLCGALLWLVSLWLGLGLLMAALSALPGTAGRWAAAATRAVLPAVLRRMIAGAAGAGVVLAMAAPVAATTPDRLLPAPSVPVTSHRGPGFATPSPLLPRSAAPARSRRPDSSVVPAAARPAPDRVVVRPGDCLWRLTADRLGRADLARISRAWQRVYRVNLAVIGTDPNLLRPGEVLDLGAANAPGPPR